MFYIFSLSYKRTYFFTLNLLKSLGKFLNFGIIFWQFKTTSPIHSTNRTTAWQLITISVSLAKTVEPSRTKR